MKFNTRNDKVEIERAEILKKAAYVIMEINNCVDTKDENNALFFLGHLKVIMGLLGESNPYGEKYAQLKVRIDDAFEIEIE